MSSAQISFTNASSRLDNGTLRSGAPMGISDMNGDGLDDIVILDDRRYLYIEYQQADTNIFVNEFITDLGGTQWSICIADVDQNGYNDIFTGGAYNNLKLIKASSDGSSYATTLIGNPPIFLQGSNFVDIDNDGDLDIFASHDEGLSVPYKNNGLGVFTPDYGLISAVSTVPSDNSGNYGSVWIDYDNDWDIDLYISKCRLGVDDPNDGRRINLLFQNDGNNNYSDQAGPANLIPFGQSWATDFGDYDNDGDLDCFIINHDVNNVLFSNDGDGTFTDRTNSAGIINALSGVGVGIQVKFEDFDCDGFLDILFTSSGANHALLRNNGNGTFSNIANAFPTNGRRIHSAVVGDLNQDGFPDVYAGFADGYNQTNNDEDYLFINNGNSNHFVKVKLEGIESNINGVGARLELYGSWGVQVREVRSGESYGIMNSMIRHFGLGSATSIDSLVVKWPSGNKDRYVNPPIDTLILFKEGDHCIATAGFSFNVNNLTASFDGSLNQGANTWEWDFGDGTTSTEAMPAHQYSVPGQYQVCLTTTGSCGTANLCKTVSIACQPLQSFFAFQLDGLDVSFQDVSLGNPGSWIWSFGDGTTSTEQNPDHGYAMPGNYVVCLTVDNECDLESVCLFVEVACGNVTVAFDTEANDELDVNFESFYSSGVTSWDWDFGDGNSSDQENPQYMYAAPGNYDVCLTVNGVCGMGQYCEPFSIDCSLPEADFDLAVDELHIALSDSSRKVFNSWFWDFSDGGTSTEQNPEYTFAEPGTYDICLTVDGPCGSDQFCRSITVTCTPPQAGFSFETDELTLFLEDTSSLNPSEWLWIINGTDSLTGPQPVYTFPDTGMYEVCLQASSVCGLTEVCKNISAYCAITAANFDYTADELLVDFSDLSTPNTTSWHWDFGDGDTSILQQNLHIYDAPGDYEVCLIVQNACGEINTFCQTLAIRCLPLQSDFTATENELAVSFADASSGNILSWNWTFGDGSQATAQSPDHEYVLPGDYEVCLSTTNECGEISTYCEVLSVACATPISGFSYSSAELSADFTDTSTGEGIQSWFWAFGDGTISAEQNPMHTYFASDDYEVCLTTTNICGASEVFCQTVSVGCAAMSPSFEVIQNELSSSFNDVSGGNITSWIWTFGDGASSNEQHPAHTYTLPGDYEVCLTINNNCAEATTLCQQISVSCAAPQSGFSFSSNFYTASFLDATTNNPATWAWSFGDGTFSSQQNPAHTYGNAGFYEVCLTTTSICGSTTTCQEIEIVCVPPDADFDLLEDELSITLNDASTFDPVEWLWTFGDGNTSDLPNPQYTYAAPGNYLLCLEVSNGCGSDQSCQQVNVSCAAPVAAFSANENELQVSFTDNSFNMPSQWQWDFGDGNASSQVSPSHTYNLPGDYEVCLTVSSVCGVNTICQSVSVSCAAPLADFSTQSDELSWDFTDLSGNEPENWTWTFGDGASSNFPDPSHTYALPGNYQVCLTVSSICGQTTVCEQISVTCSAPQAAFDYQSDNFLLQFEDLSSNEPASWLWTFGDGGFSMEASPQHIYSSTGNFQVCLQVTSICGSTNICQMVSVTCPQPQAAFDFQANELVVQFEESVLVEADNYLWNFGDGNTSTLANPEHTFTNPGLYLVCLQVSNGCGTHQICEPVMLNCSAPDPDFEVIPDGLDLTFVDVSANEPTQWLWSFGDGNTSTEPMPSHHYNTPGDYEVCLTVSSICGSNQLCKTLTVICGAPQANFVSTADELEVSFFDISEDDPSSWNWSFGDGSFSTTQNPVHTYVLPGSYMVCLSISSVCGNTQRCELVEVSCSPPQADFTFEEQVLTLLFDDQSTAGAQNWLWTFGDGGASTLANPSHTYAAPGLYEICLTVGNICGSTTFCQSVQVTCVSPVSAFFYEQNGASISFSDESSFFPNTWYWTFGDGSTSNAQNPTHTYQEVGIYEVCLEISSACGTSSYCEEVNITTGVANSLLEQQVKVFPVPANDLLWVQVDGVGSAKNIQWKLVNVLGQDIMTGQANSALFSIEVGHLPQGWYGLVLEVDGLRGVKRVVVGE